MRWIWMTAMALSVAGIQQSSCESSDADGDEWTTEDGDCNDQNADVHPGAEDIPGNGIDEDCSGADAGLEVYVVDRYDGSLSAFENLSGAPLWQVSGLGEMIGVAHSSSGELFVTRHSAGTVARVNPADGSFVDLLTGLSGPHGLWWDPASKTLLVADTGAGRILELDVDTGSYSIRATGLTQPIGVFRFPGSKDIYSTSRSLAALFLSDSAGTTTQVTSLPAVSDIISANGYDTLYISSASGSALYKIQLTDGSVSSVASAPAIYGSCAEPTGTGIYLSEHNNAVVDLYDFASGAVTPLYTGTAVPWQCASNLDPDADGDGYFSPRVGGTDCNDNNPAITDGCL